MVEKFNQVRRKEGFAIIFFDCEMFSDGKYSVDLSLVTRGCFFSSEVEDFFEMSRDNGLMLYIGSNQVSPVLHFQ